MAVAVVLVLGFTSQVVRAWWLSGVSAGRKAGIVRKVARKGSPLCRYWQGELLLGNPALFGAPTEVWEFTVELPLGESDPLLRQLQEVEALGRKVSLEYRQDKGRWWACSPNEFKVTAVVK